jgi:hypothetical protein
VTYIVLTIPRRTLRFGKVLGELALSVASTGVGFVGCLVLYYFVVLVYEATPEAWNVPFGLLTLRQLVGWIGGSIAISLLVLVGVGVVVLVLKRWEKLERVGDDPFD